MKLGPTTYRRTVEDVLGRDMTREVWTGNCHKVFPVSLQPFDLMAVLPAVFYMFRFEQRRGRGTFAQTFGGDGADRRLATVEKVSRSLAADGHSRGFEDEIGNAIMGDMLLSFCLENGKRALGRSEPVQKGRTCTLHGELDRSAGISNPPPICSGDDCGDAGRADG